MIYLSKPLLDRLIQEVQTSQRELASIQKFHHARHEAQGWTVTQVVAHLNTYNDWYLPRIENALQQSSAASAPTFKPGWLGGYVYKMMQPGERQYKAASAHRPASNPNPNLVFQKFEQGQQELIFLLELAKDRDLNRIRIPVSILPLISIKLGDALRFLVTHQQRHYLQIQKIITSNETH